MLNKEQSEACQLAIQGHNVLIVGQAGTGKSYVVAKTVEKLRKLGKCVALTAMTGIASQNYDHSLHCTTLHKWAGIEDGRNSNERISHLIKTDERFVNTLTTIKDTQVLVIDEISMLSSRLLEQVEYVCSSIKDPLKMFGGIQVIFCGDFFQLPPVPNAVYGDDGSFAFKSKLWPDLFPHTVTLTQVIRQSEQELISTINETARGRLSAESIALIKYLSRPLPVGPLPVKLLSNNLLVDQHNRDCIISHKGQLYEYQAQDNGTVRDLKRITAPQSLWLKVGAPVVLLRNLTETMTNGCRGTVIDITKDGPIVNFPSCNTTTLIERKVFTVYNPRERKQLAQRIQFPLKLAYALTIHRSQGMTLDRVEVDCRGIFKPGQLAVALGRVRSIEGLRVINFSPRYCIPQSDDLVEFYTQCALQPVQESLACCHKPIRQDLNGVNGTSCFPTKSLDALIMDADCWETLTDQTEEEIMEDDEMMLVDFQLPDTIDIKAIVDNLRIKEPITTTQENINIELGKITTDYLHQLIQFSLNIWSSLCQIYERTVPAEKVESRHWTSFYTEYHELTTGKDYPQWCKKLFTVDKLTSSHFHVCYMISVELRKRFLQLESEEAVSNAGQSLVLAHRKVTENSLADGARGKIRYVGGYCIAKLRKNVFKALQASLYQTSVGSQQRLKTARVSLDLVECLTAPELILYQHSSDQGSLHETTRKQNSRHGLTNISDKAYKFFTILCHKLLFVQSIANMQIHGERLQQFVNTILQNDAELFAKWTNIFDSNAESFGDTSLNVVDNLLSDLTYKVEGIHLLFEEVLKTYSQVMLNQLRKDYLSETQEKKLAHRHQVLTNKERTKKGSNFTYDDFVNDKSVDKQVSHCLMKGNSLKNSSYFEDSKMRKKEIATICKCYGVSNCTKDTRSILITKLVPVLNQSDSMPFPHHGLEKNSDQAEQHTPMEVESPAVDQTPMELDDFLEAGPSGENQTQTDTDEGCMECLSTHGDLWISCDWCSSWLHRNCAGLSDSKKWKLYYNTNRRFKCVRCKEE